MQYLGSKNKLSKHILPIILHYWDNEGGQSYYEPFVGGANIIDKLPPGEKIGGDNNNYIISMFIVLQKGWQPPDTLTQEEYKKIKSNPENFDTALVCFAGYLCSFGGKWFGGYAKNNKNDNYCARDKRVLLKQILNLRDVKFICCDYKNLWLKPKSFIYCDPPYQNTTSYNCNFNHKKFWEWCREKSKEGHTVIISEYNAPEDFVCIFEKKVKTVLNLNSQKDFRTEKLFMYKHGKVVPK